MQPEQPTILHWLEISENHAIRFGDLPHLLATAVAPIDDDSDHSLMKYGAAKMNFADELKTAVGKGTLAVRDALTLAFHTFPHGAALLDAVVLPCDLNHFFRVRGGIGIRLKLHGSGPGLWTIGNASEALAAQLGWHVGARNALAARMIEAAGAGQLIVLDPQTDLPFRPERVSDCWVLVTPAGVNAWLQSAGVDYRWDTIHAPPSPIKSVQRSAANAAAILAKLVEFGFDPKRLPKTLPGKKSEPKSKVKLALSNMTNAVFNKGWQHLRDEKDIVEV